MIHIVGHGIIPQMRAFEDVASALSFDRDVYLGAFASEMIGSPLYGEVIYNMEYLHDESPLWAFGYEKTLRENIVVDFSIQNVAYLNARGINAFYMPYGYSDGLVKNLRVPSYESRSIDVMFIGSMHHDRRQKIISALKDRCHTVTVENAYGDQLDKLIGLAKVHLNMHHADGQPLETVRINYLMANGCNVVSERGACETLNDTYSDGVHFCEYDEIVDTCMMALSARKNSYDVIRRMPQDCTAANNWINRGI